MNDKYVLSFGAGVNSTAILALIKQRKLSYPNLRIIFADTGCERSSTYCHLKKMQKYFDIEIVKSRLNNGQSLYDYCWKNKVVPMKMFRWCTDKFKIKPIEKWEKENNYEDAVSIIGFCKDEERRVKKRYGDKQEIIYPLIDLDIDREGCKKIIREIGWTIPEKSGCYLCPFQRKVSWLALKDNDPELFKKAIDLENNTKNGTTFYYSNKPVKLMDWLKKDEGQQRLTPFDEYQHCLCLMD